MKAKKSKKPPTRGFKEFLITPPKETRGRPKKGISEEPKLPKRREITDGQLATLWKKGTPSPNPGGRPRKWVSAVCKKYGYKKHEVLSCVTALLSFTMDELEEVCEDQHATALEVVISRGLIDSAKWGDVNKLEILLARALGHPKHTVNTDDEKDEPSNVIDYSKLSDAALREIANSIKQ